MNKKVKKIVNKISTRKNILLAKKFHNVRDKILLIWREKKSKKIFGEKTSTEKRKILKNKLHCCGPGHPFAAWSSDSCGDGVLLLPHGWACCYTACCQPAQSSATLL